MSPHDVHTIETLTRIALWIIRYAAVPATLFPLLYGFTARWRSALAGWAILTLSTAVALLIDLALFFRAWEGHYLLKAYVAVGVYALTALGLTLVLVAFARVQWRALVAARRARRTGRAAAQ